MYKSANDLYLGIKNPWTYLHTNINIYIYSIGYDFICALIFFFWSISFIEVLCLQFRVGYQVRSHVNLWQAMLNDAAISAAKTPHPGGFGENTWTNRTISKEGLEFFGGDKGCLIARFLSTHPLPPKKITWASIFPWIGLVWKEISFPRHHVGSGPWWISSRRRTPKLWKRQTWLMIPCLGSLSKWFQKTWHLNRMSRVECYRNTALRWLKIPSAPTWWVATFYAPANWHAVLAVRFHESVMVSHHESGMFFVPSLHLFFWILFCHFWCFDAWVFPMRFSTKGVCLESLVKKRVHQRVTRSFQAAQTSRDAADLDAEWGGMAPNTQGSMAGKISWQFLLGVVF